MYQKTLTQLKSQSRFRTLNLPGGIDLTSNDYLGMAVHPALRTAAIKVLQGGEVDVGAAGSRLLRGHRNAHEELESYAAEQFKAGKALFFSSGFLANYALLTGLPDRKDIIIFDEFVHASMRDGLSAGKAKSYKFLHNDMNSLENLLARNRDKAKKLWIAIESVYSMDGDSAPLTQIYDLAERYDAMIFIDEAHATGVHGENGRGLAWNLIIKHGYERMIILHTGGKAIGSAGGLVCASTDVVDYMVNTSRPFIYSTAPMPLQAIMVRKSLEIIFSSDGDERRARLFARCQEAKELFSSHGGHIIPIILGTDSRAMSAAEKLQEQGYDIRAIRPPTVPEGTARLRLSLSSEVKKEELYAFSKALEEAISRGL